MRKREQKHTKKLGCRSQKTRQKERRKIIQNYKLAMIFLSFYTYEITVLDFDYLDKIIENTSQVHYMYS